MRTFGVGSPGRILLLSLLTLSVSVTGSAGFAIERVDGDTYWDSSLALDSLGRPHMVFGGVHLYHAVLDGGAWTPETVDADELVGRGTSLGFDGAGNPGISYVDSLRRELRFARWNGAAWQIESVDTVATDVPQTSLGFEAGTNPVITYRDPAVGLKSARWDGAMWVIGVIEAGGPGSVTGRYHQLTFDRSGKAAVSYVAGDVTGHALKLARWDGVQWLTEVVDDTSVKTGLYSSLAFDSSDRAAIAYRDDTAKALRVARWTGAAWSLETVDPSNAGAATSIAFDSADRPLVSYSRGTFQPYPYLARFGGSSWSTEQIEVSGVQHKTTLLIDALDRPRIGYLSWRVALATWDGSAWTVDTVAVDRGVGDWPSLALDSSGSPLISYMNTSEGSLDLARRSGMTWTNEIVDPGFDTGWGASLIIDASDNPMVTCFDNDLGGVTFAGWDGAQWNVEAIDRTFWAGLSDSTSLALDAAGAPSVAFYDSDSAVLKYAIKRATWQIETVDSAGDVGEYPSLAYDSVGNAGISYYDYDQELLKYAHWDGAAWQIELVDATPGAGDDGTSLVFDASDSALIAYADHGLQQLKLARRLGPGWAIEVIDSTTDNGHRPSLKLDPTTGRPAVSYHAAAARSLRFARFDGVSWIRESVDAVDWVGSPSSLIMDPAGFPHIAYLDANFWVLKYAARTDWRFSMLRGPTLSTLQEVDEAALAWTDPEPVLGGGFPSLLLYQARGLETLRMVREGQSVRLSN